MHQNRKITRYTNGAKIKAHNRRATIQVNEDSTLIEFGKFNGNDSIPVYSKTRKGASFVMINVSNDTLDDLCVEYLRSRGILKK